MALPDKVIDQHGMDEPTVSSWGLQCYMVKASNVPRLIGYLLPALDAAKQRMIIADGSLVLEAFAEKTSPLISLHLG